MRRLFLTILIAALVLMGSTGTALAQGNGGGQQNRERAQNELEKTDELLASVRDAIHGSDNPMAETYLNNAVMLQESAYAQFEQENYTAAMVLSGKAREQGRKALTVSRVSDQLEGVVLQKLERAAELLDRIESEGNVYGDERLRPLLESAHNSLSRAWEFYQEGRYRPALKLAEQIEKSARKILESASLRMRSDEEYLRRRDNTLDLISRAREAAEECQSEVALGRLSDAEQFLQQAEDQFQKKNYKQTADLIRRAREAALDAYRECQGQTDLTARFQKVGSDLERLRELILEAGLAPGSPAGQMLARAEQQVDRARSLLEEGDERGASAALQAADLAIRQGNRYVAEM